MPPTYVLSPTEIINRDLDFQLMMAALYPRKDAVFVFGRMDAIARAAWHLRGSVLVGKAFDPFFPHTDLAVYRRLKAAGSVVVHIDDEGAIFPGNEDEWRRTLKRRLDPFRLAPDDFVCTWGQWQRAQYQAGAPAIASRIIATGHPRFDLLLPRYRGYYQPAAAALRQQLGDFVLLNTNLATANNGLGLTYSFSRRWGYDPADPAKRLAAVKFWRHTSEILGNFVQLVHRLSDELPQLKIVVRPHPSESQQFYRTVFAGLPNVEVAHQGSVVPWLLACRLLLHDGCTTAVEAAMAGVEIVNYKSVADDRHDLRLPNLFGRRCTSEDQVLSTVRSILAGRAGPAPAPETGDRELALFENLKGETFARLLAVVERAHDEACRRPQSSDMGALMAHETAASALETAKRGVRALSPRHGLNSAYSRVKFYGFRRSSLDERVACVERVTGRRLQLKMLSDHLLMVQPAPA